MINPKDIQQILQEPDGAELYEAAALAKCSLIHQKPTPEVDVEAQWQRFRAAHAQRKRPYWQAIAAMLAFVVCLTTVVALTLPRAVRSWKNAPAPASPAQVEIITESQPMIFHDVALGDVLDAIATEYGVQVKCADPQRLQMRLYTQVDRGLTLPEVIQLLNNFDNITIRLSGDSLIVVE